MTLIGCKPSAKNKSRRFGFWTQEGYAVVEPNKTTRILLPKNYTQKEGTILPFLRGSLICPNKASTIQIQAGNPCHIPVSVIPEIRTLHALPILPAISSKWNQQPLHPASRSIANYSGFTFCSQTLLGPELRLNIENLKSCLPNPKPTPVPQGRQNETPILGVRVPVDVPCTTPLAPKP